MELPQAAIRGRYARCSSSKSSVRLCGHGGRTPKSMLLWALLISGGVQSQRSVSSPARGSRAVRRCGRLHSGAGSKSQSDDRHSTGICPKTATSICAIWRSAQRTARSVQGSKARMPMTGRNARTNAPTYKSLPRGRYSGRPICATLFSDSCCGVQACVKASLRTVVSAMMAGVGAPEARISASRRPAGTYLRDTWRAWSQFDRIIAPK